jgi:excisionase family DNA binding protein
MDNMHQIERPARIPEAAAYAHVSGGTVRRWIRTGKLPAHRVGPLLLVVNLDDLDRLIKPVEPARLAK